MAESKTVTRRAFTYEGDLSQGLIVFAATTNLRISASVISFIKREIKKAGKDAIAMGSCRDNPSPHSLGWKLKYEYEPSQSPQLVCYVVPLLVEAGFCSVFISKTGRKGRAYFLKATSQDS